MYLLARNEGNSDLTRLIARSNYRLQLLDKLTLLLTSLNFASLKLR